MKKNKVYYCKEFNGFFQIKKILRSGNERVIISGISNYLDDAKTNILRLKVSKKFVSDCVLLDLRLIGKENSPYKFMKTIDLGSYYQMLCWRVLNEQSESYYIDFWRKYKFQE